MGLMDLDGADPEEYPPNKGGRPPKEPEEETDRTPANSDPFTLEDGEEYWEEVWSKFYDESKELRFVIAEVCDYTHTLGRTVVTHIQKHDLYDFSQHEGEWEWLDINLGTARRHKEMQEESEAESFLSGLMDDDDDDDDEEPSTGLQALIDG